MSELAWLDVGFLLRQYAIIAGLTLAPLFAIAVPRRRVLLPLSVVEARLGPPVSGRFKPGFAQDQGAECWVGNFRAGYFAAAWFRDGRVAKKKLWYSD